MPRESSESTIEMLKRRFGDRPFRVIEAVEVGASRTTLHRLRESGALSAPGRGMLQLPNGGLGMMSALAVVSARAPMATVCLNSALSYWDLTDEIPLAVHIAVPTGSRRPAISIPKAKVHVFNARTFDIDRQRETTDADEPFWVYSAERSVVDALRMPRWVGRDVGLHALRRYMSRPGAKPAHLTELARILGGTRALTPALEALLS